MSRSDSATRLDVSVDVPTALGRHAATILLAGLSAPGHAAGAHAPMPATSDSPSQSTGIEGSPGPPVSTGVIAVNVRIVQRRKLPRVTSSHPDEPQSTCPGARGAGLAATSAAGVSAGPRGDDIGSGAVTAAGNGLGGTRSSWSDRSRPTA